MLKKEIAEVKKCFSKKKSCINHAAGCYVNGDGSIISDVDINWNAISEDDVDMYQSLMRKGLSGKQGKNLYDISFPTKEEEKGGKQFELYQLLKDQFENKEAQRAFFENVAANVVMDSPYLILLSGGVYDAPKKASDGAILEDETQDVYQFIQCLICPVSPSKSALIFDEKAKTFTMAVTQFVATAPVTGFLFPAFNDRQTDIHSLLYYTKKEEERHEEFLTCITGCEELPDAETTQKTKLAMVVENTLGRDCDFTSVKNITETLDRAVEETDEETGISKNDICRAFRESGIPTDKAENVEENFEKIVGKTELKGENIASGNVMKLESTSMKASISKAYAATLEARVIDGREFILLPVENDMSLNGVHLKAKAAAE